MRLTRTGFIVVLSLMSMDLIAQVPQVKSFPVDCWSAQLGTGCTLRSGRDALPTEDWTVYGSSQSASCNFTDLVPLGGTVISVNAKAFLLDGYSFDLIAQAAMSLNALALGSQSLMTEWAKCDVGSFVPFDYVTGSYPAGVPGYQVGGQNSLTMNFSAAAAIEAVDLSVTFYPPPPIDFDIKDTTPEVDRRVLISNLRQGYDYPAIQKTLGLPRKIPIKVRVNDANGPVAGMTVYFKVTDPPDPSPYVAGNPVRPNVDAAAGVLTGSGITPMPNSKIVQATSGSGGLVEMILEVTGQHAGDNYAVEGSFDSSFSCTPNCGKTGVITAWKRMFVEKDQMFRKGAALAADASKYNTVIRVRPNSAGFARDKTIRLMHAPYRDGKGPLNSQAQIDLRFWSEEKKIMKVENDRDPGNKGGSILTLYSGLDNNYYLDLSFQGSGTLEYLNDGIGLVEASPSQTYLELNTGDLPPAFADSFTEYVFLDPQKIPFENKLPYVPHVADLGGTGWVGHFASKWFENSEHASPASGGLPCCPRTNHQYLFGANEYLDPSRPGTFVLGSTAGSSKWSVAWVRTIERGCSERRFYNNAPLLIYPCIANNVIGEVVVHEIAHQFPVNPAPRLEEHCGEKVYRQHPAGSSADCVMHQVQDANANDRIVAFHYLIDASGNVDSEYTAIRSAPDPLP